MPKLPVIKAKILLKAIQRAGFYQFHQAGSHVQMKNRQGRRITVPFHPSQEIRRGTLRGIIDYMGLSVEKFIALLKK